MAIGPLTLVSFIRFYLHIAYLAGIVFVTHYILATMVLMLGVATNKHCALVPWFVSQVLIQKKTILIPNQS